jgi:hypothetical protein
MRIFSSALTRYEWEQNDPSGGYTGVRLVGHSGNECVQPEKQTSTNAIFVIGPEYHRRFMLQCRGGMRQPHDKSNCPHAKKTQFFKVGISFG